MSTRYGKRLSGRRPSVEDIADAQHVSSRTLQRQLQDIGFNFQRAMEEARHELARHYLDNSVLELNEPAHLLGYEDENSFVRAPTWVGVPPARWRERQCARAS
jgi:AraC-like DNA-binding protein